MYTIKNLVGEKLFHRPVDDKSYLMEKVIQFAAGHPVDSQRGARITGSFITTPWTDLKTPSFVLS